jgi:hypothetical protein
VLCAGLHAIVSFQQGCFCSIPFQAFLFVHFLCILSWGIHLHFIHAMTGIWVSDEAFGFVKDGGLGMHNCFTHASNVNLAS